MHDANMEIHVEKFRQGGDAPSMLSLHFAIPRNISANHAEYYAMAKRESNFLKRPTTAIITNSNVQALLLSTPN
jgi:hypothetical protein